MAKVEWNTSICGYFMFTVIYTKKIKKNKKLLCCVLLWMTKPFLILGPLLKEDCVSKRVISLRWNRTNPKFSGFTTVGRTSD